MPFARIDKVVPKNRGNGKVWANSAAKRRIIVGLGNPGPAYARHRHNLGFAVVDRLAVETGGSWTKTKDKAQTCRVDLDGEDVLLVKPQTFMNLSGQAVAPLLGRVPEAASRMIVIHDDLDLALGRLRVKVGGGDGGHKGVRSIADSLRFRDFIRVRLGVGRPPAGVPAEEYVLRGFLPDEREAQGSLVKEACEAVRLILQQGVESAQNAIHSLKKAAGG
jgi:peptidyl-tRNA hydrolase, PTH1 family